MVNNNLHVFIKYNEENPDFPNVRTMAEHIKVLLEKGEFCWGHFTKTKASRNKNGLWEMRTNILDKQIEEGTPTLVFFYSRVSAELYVGVLKTYYDREYPDSHPEIKELIPQYYHSRVGKIERGMEGEMRSYAFVRVNRLIKVDLDDTQHIFNYKGSEESIGVENVLEVKNMTSLLYVNLEEQYYDYLKRKLIDSSDDLSATDLETDHNEKEEYNIGELNVVNEKPHSVEVKKQNSKVENQDMQTNKNGTNRDYEKSQRKNKSIGDAGELIVLNEEIKRLRRLERDDLAEKVMHVSQELGDKEGYDILSYDIIDGIEKEKYIEVKTTEHGRNTHFYITEHEVNFSRQNSENYYLYRLYNYDKKTGNANCYIINGNIEEELILTPDTYKVFF